MSCLLGIDLGTSSVKVVVFAVEGGIKGLGLAEYPILTPRVGRAEQHPEEWWRATVNAVREALGKAGHPEILGTGFSGPAEPIGRWRSPKALEFRSSALTQNWKMKTWDRPR